MSTENKNVVATIDVAKVEKLNKAITQVADLSAKLEKAKADETALRSEIGSSFMVAEVKVKRGGRPIGSKNKPKAAKGEVNAIAGSVNGSAPAAPVSAVADVPSV